MLRSAIQNRGKPIRPSSERKAVAANRLNSISDLLAVLLRISLASMPEGMMPATAGQNPPTYGQSW